MSGQLANFCKVVSKRPKVNDGVTIFHYSDRSAGTVRRVSKSGKTVWFTGDIATRIDNNGMSESQKYSYSSVPHGTEIRASLRKDGQWRLAKDGRKITFGIRAAYHDFSF